MSEKDPSRRGPRARMSSALEHTLEIAREAFETGREGARAKEADLWERYRELRTGKRQKDGD